MGRLGAEVRDENATALNSARGDNRRAADLI